MNPKLLLIVYILTFLASFILEVVIKKLHFNITRTHYKEHHFVLGKYVVSLLFPILAIIIIYSRLGSSIIYTFFASAILGTFLEWLCGWWFYHIMGTRLWTYHRYSITKYTSFLSIPLWGLAGIFFLLIVKLFSN